MDPNTDRSLPHDLDRTVLRLPCFEPAGRSLELSGEALTRNTLLTGAIGSGKTSTLNRMLAQLISYRADEPDSKIGLLIFDFKRDGTADQVRGWAREVGRGDDVLVLSEHSDTRVELFDNFHSLDQLEETVETLLAAIPPEKGDNIYWEYARRKRLTTALTIFRTVHDGVIYGPEMFDFIEDYILSGKTRNQKRSEPEAIERFEAMVEDLPEVLRRSLFRAANLLDEWRGLDERTRSNEQSTMTNLLNLLSSHASHPYFGGRDKRVLRIGEVIEQRNLNAICGHP